MKMCLTLALSTCEDFQILRFQLVAASGATIFFVRISENDDAIVHLLCLCLFRLFCCYLRSSLGSKLNFPV